MPFFFQNVETQTIPPPRSTFGSYVLQWIIYDSYAEDFEQSEREKEKERKVRCLSYVDLQIDKSIVLRKIAGGKCVDISTIETI